MKDKESQVTELSRQYWEALEEMDYINPNFCESALHMMGEKPLKKDEKTSNSACIVWQFCYNIANKKGRDQPPTTSKPLEWGAKQITKPLNRKHYYGK